MSDYLHTETRNGYTLTVEYEQFADDPTNWGNFKIVTFGSNNLITDTSRDDYFDDDDTPTAELHEQIISGKAFPFNYHEHGQSAYVLADADELHNASGLIIFDDGYVDGALYDERRVYAEQDLQTYTDWANGNVYSVRIIEDATDELVDGNGDCYDLEHTIAQGRETLKRIA